MTTPILKFVFSLLLAANVGLFVYQHGYLDALLPSSREPARMSNQVNADKIKLVPPAQSKRNEAPVSMRGNAATPASALAVAPVAEATEPVIPGCVEIGNFTQAQARRFSAELAPLALGERVSQRNVQEVFTYMVYIPPLPDRETAEKATLELRQLGVTDYYIIRDNSPLRMAISLGVFNTEEAARTQLASLSQKGVRTARIGQRSVPGNAVVFRIRDLDADGKTALAKVKAAFPRQEMRGCEEGR